MLTRFIFDKRHFSPNNARVKTGAFMPVPSTGETSVYLTKDVSDKDIWCLGLKYVEPQRVDRKKIRARGDFPLENVLREGLEILEHGQPHPRHVSIVNWPAENHKQRKLALSLSLLASLSIYESEPTLEDCEDSLA